MTEWKPDTALHVERDRLDFSGLIPESWLCVDCGFNTAPGLKNTRQAQAEAAMLGALWDNDLAGIDQRIGFDSEVYTVRAAVWKKAGMEEMGGCLCIGCLEKRIGRRLKPKDFYRDHPFNTMPGTQRLLDRRK
jgi:hypothetical protein